MKEIDFLPEWYKSDKRRQIAYRTQYVALVGIFAVIVVWNFLTGQSVSRVEAQLSQMAVQQARVDADSLRYIELKGELAQLHQHGNLIEQIDSRMDVAATLAELSFLTDSRIVLEKVDMISERFTNKQPQATPGVIRAVGANLNVKESIPLGKVRFRIILAGVAVESGDVALLIRKLEESPYFSQVELSFSREAEIQTGRNTTAQAVNRVRPNVPSMEPQAVQTGQGIGATRFEVSCYLANYRQK